MKINNEETEIKFGDLINPNLSGKGVGNFDYPAGFPLITQKW